MDPTLKDTVFAIIDSRIQFIEYEQNSLLKGYNAPPETITGNELTEVVPLSKMLTRTLDQMIEKIEDYSKTLRLLIVLRSHLQKENAAIVLELLTNHEYLKYSVEALIQKIQLDQYLKSA